MLHTVVLVTLAGLVAADFDLELHAKYQTMSKSAFIEYFNAQDYSWKMAEYDDIHEEYAACEHIDTKAIENLPLKIHDLEGVDLPVNFDARINWPQCDTIKQIYAQKNCGSCWTFGTATTASDRTCIHKNVNVNLSEQDLECLPMDVCGGGNSLAAFMFWQNNGLVTQQCKPYDIPKLYMNTCNTQCVNPDINYKNDKHFAEMVYRLSNESNQIKAELVKNGPIQASYIVFKDFTNYKSGVYVHMSGVRVGGHSVRILGYGVEDGIDYWLVANSWGTKWGDQGVFKIKAYQKEVGFENLLATGLPK